MQRISSSLFALLALVPLVSAQSRVPGEEWLRYADPAEAGWSTEKLAEAKAFWESIGSAAWMVIENGVVIVAWGDCDRRYMCHSVRKSFMSGLYGIHVDAGTIDTEKTLAEMGIDDEPKLTEVEKGARIEDLLRARSGIYKLAAYEPPQNPKPPRGSHAPGTFWCYNNFDFNTLCTIFEEQTGKTVFEEFDARFAQPLGMQDFRVRDGYYHYEYDKSIHPAYPFRLSARDSARYGLLFLNQGAWGEDRILSREWVERSTASHSDTGNNGDGYGYMWWVLNDPIIPGLKGYAARGVGGQMIAVLPEAGLVVINRTDTYMRRNVDFVSRARLIAMILDAQPDSVDETAELVPLESSVVPIPALDDEHLARYVGTYDVRGEESEVRSENGVLVLDMPSGGAFGLAPVEGEENIFFVEDMELYVLFERVANGELGSILPEFILLEEFRNHIQDRNFELAQTVAERLLELFPMSAMSHVMLGRAFHESGDSKLAWELVEAALEIDPEHQEARALARTLQR